MDIVDKLGKSLVFVINAATPGDGITGEAAIALSQHGTVAPVTVHHRTEFASSMIDGRTVMELSDTPQSTEEIVQLWAYLANRLDRCTRSIEPQQRNVAFTRAQKLASYAGPRKETA